MSRSRLSVRSILLRKRKRGMPQIIELLQDQLQRRHLLVVGLADHHRGIAAGERSARFLRRIRSSRGSR